jgi:crossover junction endodeoxyribonuclease RuvC
MLILGIDPGIARMGWGLLSENEGQLKLIDVGCFETKAGMAEPERLKNIYQFLIQLIQKHRPGVLSIEELFFASNAKTAFTVGQARGVVLLAATLAKLQINSYTPLQVKQSLTGYGRADKKQIQIMVKSILHLNTIPQPDDAADALAIAITHAFSYKFNKSALIRH